MNAVATKHWLLVIGVWLFACTSDTKPAASKVKIVVVDDASVGSADAASPIDAGVLVRAGAPLVCRFCKTAPPGGDASGFFPECPTADAPLDDMQRARFRIDEVTEAMNGPFAQAMTWGSVADEGVGLAQTGSETRIEGEVMLGDFVFHACSDSVSATATVSFATADGQLAATAHGGMELSADALGWPKGAVPELSVGASDDLSNARGTFDLGADPNKLELGQMFFNLTRSSEGVRGFVRIRREEFPDQAALDAANVPTDLPSSRIIHEVGMGLFPLDRCNGHGVPFETHDPSGALAGGTWGDVLSQAWTMLGPRHAVDARWRESGQATRVQVELGTPPTAVCANAWSAELMVSGQVQSADGLASQPLTTGAIVAQPYTKTLSRVALHAPNFMAEVLLPEQPGAASSGSMMRDDAQHIVVDTLIWPPPPPSP